MSSQILHSNRALLLATLAFAVNFSVWTLYSVMGIELKTQLSLSATEFGLLLSAPILTGALFRLPIGLLCERYSSKKLFTIQMLLLIPALLALPQAATYSEYLLLGLVIGISGVSFTIGIRYVTDWFHANEQGMAMGVFGAGNAGAALSLIFIPMIIHHWGWQQIGPTYAVAVGVTAVLFWLFAPDLPLSRRSQVTLPLEFYLTPLRQAKVWRFGLYYYFVFGSFLALLLWLPQYYVQAYALPFNQAMALTLLFVISSSMARAAGGWFADRFGARTINWSVFWICLVCLFFLSYPPTTMTIHGVNKEVNIYIELNVWVFTALLLIIGLAQGFGRASVYKLINDYYPQQMGSVGGMVAMLGALGGCTLPILFGIAVDWIGVYSACFMLLYGVLAACMLLMHLAIKQERYEERLQEAVANNFLNQD
ncbi:MAG: NNP family nitrate/nitrite transporter-like MFS transporter [Paraglaciecola sp.]|jgi:NNP family nitrate/nitrite transporter-like MFS transporter